MMRPPRICRFFPLRLFVALAIALITAGTCPECKSAPSGRCQPCRARILVVRGGFTVFSLGLNTLAAELRAAGYQVDLACASLSALTAARIADEFELYGRPPLVIIGHSLGADLTPHLARYFQGRGIPVKLAVLLDSPLPSSMPGNVERCVNIYNSGGWSAPVLSGRATSGMIGRSQVFNIDLAQLGNHIPEQGIDHFTIDASPWIHQVVVRAVRLSCEPPETRRTTGRNPPPQRIAAPLPPAALPAAQRIPEPPSQAEAGPRFRR
jgi:pimeloyl-ACP methyl ester carboxylesterase